VCSVSATEYTYRGMRVGPEGFSNAHHQKPRDW
jgi:hypothetical protein